MTQLNDITSKLDPYAFAISSLRDPVFCAIALGEESGEVLGKFKKWMRDAQNFPDEISPSRRMEILIELGDVLFYLIYLIKSLNSTPEEVLTLLEEKIASRQVRGTQHGEGDNR